MGWGFPNPIDWALDKVTGFLGDAAASGFGAVIAGLVAWVLDAVVWVVGGIFNFFLDASDPNVQADWFRSGHGPFATTAVIGAGLLVLFVLLGVIQGVLAGDTAGMLRRFALDLPMSILAMASIITVTQILIRVTDDLSMTLIGQFQDDVSQFGTVVASLQQMTGGPASALVVFVLGLATVFAGLILVAELVIRASLIYIVVALSPLVLAARLWPATRGATRRLLELLGALIFSKLVIAIALAVSAAAAAGATDGGAVTALPPPEVFAEDPGGSVTQAVGILLTAAVTFGVAAFSPMLVLRLVPLTEAAIVAHGVRGGAVRAAQQTLMVVNTTQLAAGRASGRFATGPSPISGPPPGGGAGGTRTPSPPRLGSISPPPPPRPAPNPGPAPRRPSARSEQDGDDRE